MRAFPIHTDDDLERAIELLDELEDSEPGSEEGDLAEVMATLVDLYESTIEPSLPADPIVILTSRLQSEGITQNELARRAGIHRGRVSDLVNRRRGLTAWMAMKLSAALRLPPGVLASSAAYAEVKQLQRERVTVTARESLQSTLNYHYTSGAEVIELEPRASETSQPGTLTVASKEHAA